MGSQLSSQKGLCRHSSADDVTAAACSRLALGSLWSLIIAERHTLLPDSPEEIRESCARLANQLWKLSRKIIHLSNDHKNSCDYTRKIQNAVSDVTDGYCYDLFAPFNAYMNRQRMKAGLRR